MLVFRSYSSSADDNELTKLKVVFNNKVKTGKLIIRKVPAEGRDTGRPRRLPLPSDSAMLAAKASATQSSRKTYTCTVENHNGDEYYGEIVIDKIPVGTRFVVSEK